MKKIKILFCIIAIFAFSCEKICEIKKPKGLKPIDGENYNDVYTVYWNYLSLCDNRDWKTGEIVGVYGWIFQGFEGGYPPVNPKRFCLIDKEENIFALNSSVGTSLDITINYNGDYKDLIDSLQNKFADVDITKKCFVRGEVHLPCLESMRCSYVAVEIFVANPDDIYFEE